MTDNLTAVAIVSDLHINATVSVCPPVVNLDDGGTYHASRGQRWLYDCWLDFVDKIGCIEGRVIVILGGDLAELDTKRRSVQLISQNKSTIQSITSAILEPLMAACDNVIVIRGTPAHEGKGCWIEETIASDYDHVIPQSKSIKSWYYFRGSIGGMRFDVSHHASMAGKDAMSYRSPLNLAEQALWFYRVQLQQESPHYVIRAHQHRYRQAQMHGLTSIFTPCFSLAPEYLFRAGKEMSVADIGGILIQGDNVTPVLYEPKENRQIWKVRV